MPLAGVDEVGRGPLAGPVVAAAVILPAGYVIEGLTDSKLLRPSTREELFQKIIEVAESVGVGIVGPEEIDMLNIVEATRKAMELAVNRLGVRPAGIVIDGLTRIRHPSTQVPIVKADRKSHCVSAASVVAKVVRDRIMVQYHHNYPKYGFCKHKGYGTREHIRAISLYGLCPIHRRSFKLKALSCEAPRSVKGKED